MKTIVNIMTVLFLSVIILMKLKTSQCDLEVTEFPNVNNKEEPPDDQTVFPVDNMALLETVNLESSSKEDNQPSFQNSKLPDVDKDEVVFSVLENSKTKDEQGYIMDGVMITDADLPKPSHVENKTLSLKNKTLTVECALSNFNDDEGVSAIHTRAIFIKEHTKSLVHLISELESSSSPTTYILCGKLENLMDNLERVQKVPSVIIANSTLLLKVLTPNTTNSTVGECSVVLFFSSQCVFSARMAPHYNALARVFPGITFYALDTAKYYSVHMRYGVVSVPNIFLFHNGKAVTKFNESVINLDNLVNFVTKYTNLQHNGTLNVTSADMNGPVPATLTKRIDLVLILAWAFTIFCICLWFLRSALCHRIVESIKNTWREAEAQHEHAD